jgi:hypothetical protein
MKHIPFFICLLLAATPGILIATLPAWATKDNITVVPKLNQCTPNYTYVGVDDGRHTHQDNYRCWVV